MALFAPVAPVQVLHSMLHHGVDTFGHYHLLLAHHTLERAEEFTDLFKDVHSSAPRRAPIVIMDNSIVELGASQSAEVVKEATEIVASACPPAYVIPVLPDVMGDGEATRAIVEESYADWDANMKGNGFMVVLQGSSLDDYTRTCKFFLDNREQFPNISWLGVPRVLHKTCGGRVIPMDILVGLLTERNLLTSYNVHLLGFSDDMVDDYNASRHELVYGIDSAVPLRMSGKFELSARVGPRPEDWFDTAVFSEDMRDNVQRARAIFGNLPG